MKGKRHIWIGACCLRGLGADRGRVSSNRSDAGSRMARHWSCPKRQSRAGSPRIPATYWGLLRLKSILVWSSWSRVTSGSPVIGQRMGWTHDPWSPDEASRDPVAWISCLALGWPSPTKWQRPLLLRFKGRASMEGCLAWDPIAQDAHRYQMIDHSRVIPTYPHFMYYCCCLLLFEMLVDLGQMHWKPTPHCEKSRRFLLRAGTDHFLKQGHERVSLVLRACGQLVLDMRADEMWELLHLAVNLYYVCH